MPDLFAQLDDAWTRRASSPAVPDLLARWVESEPALAPFTTMHAVVEAARGRSGQAADQWDAVQLALLRLSDHDEDARLTLLFVLRPGLTAVSRTYAHQWGDEDTAASVVLLALERVANHPRTASVRPGAWIVLGVRNDLMRRRLKELTAEAVLGARVPMPDTVSDLTERQLSPSDEVIQLLDEALATGHLTDRGRRLIILHRVFSVPTRDVAAVEGRTPAAIRQYRNRAEAAMAETAMEVA